VIAAGALANSLALAPLLLAIAWLTTRGSRVPATRHAIWTAALLLLPVLSLGVALAPVQRVASAAPPTTSSNIPRVLVLAWLALATLHLVRLAVAYSRMRALQRGARPSPELQQRIDALRASMRVKRAVGCGVSDAVPAPLMAGCGRAMVLVPQAFIDGFPRADGDRILAHELAHAARRDDWTRAAAQLVRALFFFHPAVFVMARRMEFECELASDVAASRLDGRAPYAAALARLVLGSARPNAFAAAAIAKPASVAHRVEALLALPDASPRFTRLRLASAFVLALATTLAASPLLVRRVVLLAPIALMQPARGAVDAVDVAEDAAAHYGSGLSLLWGGHNADAAQEFRAAYDAGYEPRESALGAAIAYQRAGDLARSAEWARAAR